MHSPGRWLLDEVEAMCADAHVRRIVLEHCPGLDPASSLTSFSSTIHPQDQMLLHSLREHRDAGAAFSQYFAIALQQYASARQILDKLFGAEVRDLEVLDFACGFGRLLRFLSLAMPPSRIHACELQPEAVAFVAREFGVQALASSADPENFKPERRFDFIWVASLFSHLPEPLFHAWLTKLLGLLTPRGVLCFSVRDAALLPFGQVLPASGIVYAGESENEDLGSDIYGTTYADEAFVQRAVSVATGDGRKPWRLRKALAQEQDLYVVAADSERDLSALGTFRRGPWGWLDRRHLTASGTLHIEGWAASLDDGVVDAVDVDINGHTHSCKTGILRPDVSAAFSDPRLAAAGWRFQCAAGPVPSIRIAVSACTRKGERALLYVGKLDADERAASA